MDIAKTFALAAPVGVAWDFLIDPRRVAACLPGAAITGQRDEQTYTGTITVKVGPVSATYKGTLRFERLDPVGRTAELVAAGQDVRGKGGAEMRMISRLVERAPGETEVTVTSEVNVMGVLAQFGRGMIQDVSDQMFQKFVEAMRRQLEAPAHGNPAETGSPAEAVKTHGEDVTAAAGKMEVHVEPSAPAASAGMASVQPRPVADHDDPIPPGQPPVDVLSMGSSALLRAALRVVQRRGAQVWRWAFPPASSWRSAASPRETAAPGGSPHEEGEVRMEPASVRQEPRAASRESEAVESRESKVGPSREP